MTGDLLRFPSSVPESGSSADTNLDVIDEVLEHARTAAWSALELQKATRHADPVVKRAATNALDALLECAAPARTPRPQQVASSKLLDVGSSIEDRLDRWRRRMAVASRFVGPVSTRVWTLIGLAATLGACWAIVHHLLILATVIIVGRVLISAAVGYDTDLSFVGARDQAESDGWRTLQEHRSGPVQVPGSGIVLRCLLGHVTDGLPLLALAYVLSVEGRSMWASVVLVGACIMFTATLYRVSALQVGTALNRLTLERPIRTVSVIGALIAAAQWQHVVPGFGTAPVVALAAVGPVLYALIEIVRTTLRLRLNDVARSANPWSVLVAVRECDSPPWIDEDVTKAG